MSFLAAADARSADIVIAKAVAEADDSGSLEIHATRVASLDLPAVSDLREIDLCGNANLAALPGPHVLAGNLRSFASCRGALTSLPPHLREVQCRKLFVAHNKLTTLDALPKGVTVLDASSNHLSGDLELTVPTTLSSIKLGTNKLTTLHIRAEEPPADLNALPPMPLMIGSLDASNNALTAPPSGIGGPESGLSTLKLHGNRIESIPPELMQSSRLMELDLSANALASLPDLDGLVSLRKLVLSRNELRWFPESIWKLPALLELHIANNQISKLPPPPSESTKTLPLVELMASRNSLEDLPTSLATALPSLTRLDVSYNTLTTLPSFSGLRFLHASHNALHTPAAFANILEGSKKLTVLHARGTSVNRGDSRGWANILKATRSLSECEVSLDEPDSVGGCMTAGGKHMNSGPDGDLKATLFSGTCAAPIGWLRCSGGVAMMCGRRRSMEDYASIDLQPSRGYPSAGAPPPWLATLAGVYDGHGGDEASELVATALPKAIVTALSPMPAEHPPPTNALVSAVGSAFASVAEMVMEDEGTYGWVGTTVTTAMILHPSPSSIPGLKPSPIKLLIANLGDSAALLLRNGTPEFVSAWQRPSDPTEEMRICAAGGFVSPEGEMNGMLGVARAFGDLGHPLPPSSIPAIRVIDLPSDESATLILASDGLWDVVEADEIVPLLKQVGKSAGPAEMAAVLRDEAFARGSADNVSVVVICLRAMGECAIGGVPVV